MRPERMRSASTSSAPSRGLTPSMVFIVRWPSGVTRISERPVGSPPPAAAAVLKVTPAARMSWRNTLPNSSFAVLAMKPALPPNEATPTIVFAAEPPEISMPGPIAS